MCLNDDISDNKKTSFVSKVQTIIEAIERGRLKSDDNKWLEFEQQVRTAKKAGRKIIFFDLRNRCSYLKSTSE